jgi:hypothetical protein
MNADEIRIVELLNDYPDEFVSVAEISKKLGKGRRFKDDKLWARPILRRLEMDGLLEVNDVGDYRVRMTDEDNGKKSDDRARKTDEDRGKKTQETEQINFKQALKTPGVSLGDTTIISIGDVQDQGTASRNRAVR